MGIEPPPLLALYMSTYTYRKTNSVNIAMFIYSKTTKDQGWRATNVCCNRTKRFPNPNPYTQI